MFWDYVRKYFKPKRPDYLFEQYGRIGNVNLRETRYGDLLLQTPIHRTVTYNKSVHVLSITLMNMLKRSIRESGSHKILLKEIKKELLKRYE